MSKFIVLLCFLSSSLFSNIFTTLGIYDLGMNILTEPDRFFQGYQYEIENLNPSFFKRELPFEWVALSETEYDNVLPYWFFSRFSISTSPTTLIWSIFNYHIKAHVLEEAIYLPQITVGFGHHFYLPIYNGMGKAYEKKLLDSIKLNGFSGDLIFSKSVNYRTKFFFGYRFAYGRFSWDSKKFIESYTEVSSVTINKTDFDWQLHDIIFGLAYLIPHSYWEVSGHLGMDPVKISIFAKTEFTYKFIGFGLGFYPNNILKIRPYLRIFFNFF